MNSGRSAGLRSATTAGLICLDGAVTMYAETLSFVAWKLRHEGIGVVRLGCDGVLAACTSVNSTGNKLLSGEEKQDLCRRCKEAQRQITASDVVSAEAGDASHSDGATRFLNELEARLKAEPRIDAVLDMAYQELPLCRMAFFDFSIVTKFAPDTALHPESIARFVAGVRDLLVLLNMFDRMRGNSAISHLVFVNGNYTQNTLARKYFGRLGVVCLSIEPQLTSQHVLNRIIMASERFVLNPDGLYPGVGENSGGMDGSVRDAVDALKNFGARIKGADFNAYTSLDGRGVDSEESKRLQEFLPRYQRIHSYFLSSEDELVPHIVSHEVSPGSEENPFGPYRTQIEFTRYLIKLASESQDIGFIIRLHPRMAVNKRDKFESEEHKRYRELLAETDLPENVLFLLGDSKISSYYIISRSALVIISWSTIGLEALLLGVPVIAAFPDYLMYPIARFCEQPKCGEALASMLCGRVQSAVLDDHALIGWVGMAFEGQFFEVAAPRGMGGILGRAYRVLYRISRKVGAYSLLAAAVNLLCLGKVRLDSKRLLVVDNVGRSKAGDRRLLDLLESYRMANRSMLNEYGKTIENVH